MKNTYRVLALVILLFFSFQAFSQTRIVVIGSSTAAGTGASVYDSSWVGRLQLYYRQNTSAGNPDTVVTNLAVGGYTTYQVMPDGYTPPPNRPAPVPTNNVTRALSFNPQVIIINLPTNDIGAGYGPVEFMNNLRFLFQHINSAGVRAFITTTQPRTQYAAPERQILRNLVDSINNNFGVYAIDFWTDLATTDGQNNIRPEVNSGDNIHINNLGHRLVFERVRAEFLFVDNSPLPVRITSFKGRSITGRVELSWETASEEAGTKFTIQRSSNGVDFTDLSTQPGNSTNGNGSYSFTDRSPLNKNYYRLKIQEGIRSFYSAVILVEKDLNGLVIKKLYKQNSSVLSAEIEIEKSADANIAVYNANGQVVLKQKRAINTGTSIINVPIGLLSPGQYFFSIKTGDHQLTQSFIK